MGREDQTSHVCRCSHAPAWCGTKKKYLDRTMGICEDKKTAHSAHLRCPLTSALVWKLLKIWHWKWCNVLLSQIRTGGGQTSHVLKMSYFIMLSSSVLSTTCWCNSRQTHALWCIGFLPHCFSQLVLNWSLRCLHSVVMTLMAMIDASPDDLWTFMCLFKKAVWIYRLSSLSLSPFPPCRD